jgi:hypothetical protein
MHLFALRSSILARAVPVLPTEGNKGVDDLYIRVYYRRCISFYRYLISLIAGII